MLNQTYFITPADIKLLIPDINKNIDDKFITPNIILTQELEIRPMLGIQFYNQLVSGITYNSLTALETELMDNYLVRMIAYGTYKRLIYTTSYQLENTGLRVKENQTSVIATRDELALMAQNLQNIVDHYKLECERYLCANKTSFPLYTVVDQLDAPAANRTGNFGFHLDSIDNYTRYSNPYRNHNQADE